MDNVFNAFVNKFSSLPPVLTFIVMVLLIVSYFYKDAINKVGAIKPAEKARAVQAYQARVKAIRDAIVQTEDAE